MFKQDIKFDKTDYDILLLMHEDARMPASTIASELNLDVRTVKRRLDAILESGAVRKTVVTNPENFGFSSIIEVKLDVEADKLSEYVDKFVADERIPFVGVYWNINRIDLQCRFRTNKEIYDFVHNELYNLQGAKVVLASIVPTILKNVDLWIPDKRDFED